MNKVATLHIGSAEFRIEENEVRKIFLFADCGDAGMAELAKSEFMEKLLECAHVALVSWDEKLTADYCKFYKLAFNYGE